MMIDENNVSIVSVMRECKLPGVFCLAIILSACVSRTPEWSENDEAWWNQSETFPNHVITAPAANKVIKSKPVAKVLKEPVVIESSTVALSVVEIEQKKDKDVVAIKEEVQEVQAVAPIKVYETANEKGISADTELKAETNIEIMRFPAEYFTVQLLASVDMESVEHFMKKHQVPTSFVVTTEKDKRIWYVLLLDVYESYDSAVLARNSITHSMERKPWIRSIGSVQKITKK